MTFHFSADYDPTTDVGAVRLLLRDIDLSVIPTIVPLVQPPRKLWTVFWADEEILATLGKYTSDNQDPVAVYYAAAELLEGMATNSAYFARLIKIGDYEKDSSKGTQFLQKQADRMRAIANNIPYEAITDSAWTDANYARLLYNRFLTST